MENPILLQPANESLSQKTQDRTKNQNEFWKISQAKVFDACI